MRQIRELLRLRLRFEEGLSQRLIRGHRVMRCTVRVLKRFAASGLGWPPDPSLTDEELERRLYRRQAHVGTAKSSARPTTARPRWSLRARV